MAVERVWEPRQDGSTDVIQSHGLGCCLFNFPELPPSLKTTRMALAFVVVGNYACEGLARGRCVGWSLQTARTVSAIPATGKTTIGTVEGESIMGPSRSGRKTVGSRRGEGQEQVKGRALKMGQGRRDRQTGAVPGFTKPAGGNLEKIP